MSSDVTFYLRIKTLAMVVLFSVVFKLVLLYTNGFGLFEGVQSSVLLITYFDPKTPPLHLAIIAIPDVVMVVYFIYALIKDEQMNYIKLPYVLFDCLVLIFAFLCSNLLAYVIPFIIVVIMAIILAIF